MLSALSGAGVEYLVVGAYALAAHGLPRATGDLDVWIRATPANAERAWSALATFGAPMRGITVSALASPDTVIQIGLAPHRIDVLTDIDGVDFEEAWDRRVVVDVDELRVPVIGRDDLIRNKRATARPQDLADVDALDGPGDGNDRDRTAPARDDTSPPSPDGTDP